VGGELLVELSGAGFEEDHDFVGAREIHAGVV
jgi:hypothetical protein